MQQLGASRPEWCTPAATRTERILDNRWLLLRFPLPFIASIVIWLFVVALVAVGTGWRALARRFTAMGDDEGGERFRFVSGKMGVRGLAGYGNSLSVRVGRDGIGLAVLPVFRFMHPPMFIPWSAVAGCDGTGAALWRGVMIRLRETPTRIVLRGSVGEAVLREWRRVSAG